MEAQQYATVLHPKVLSFCVQHPLCSHLFIPSFFSVYALHHPLLQEITHWLLNVFIAADGPRASQSYAVLNYPCSSRRARWSWWLVVSSWDPQEGQIYPLGKIFITTTMNMKVKTTTTSMSHTHHEQERVKPSRRSLSVCSLP